MSIHKEAAPLRVPLGKEATGLRAAESVKGRKDLKFGLGFRV